MKQILQENKRTFLYIAVAYIFSVVVRFIWVYQFKDYAPFHFNGEFMINTNDGYAWAEGARDILAGFHQPHDNSPIHTAISQLTAFFAQVLPFKFETIIFYMPVFLSSLVVIPIVLIAKTLKNLEMGLIAALLASIAWSYYNRTMVGYFDTDMLNIVLPMFLLWSIIWAINTQKSIYTIIIALDILIYRWWYAQSYSLELSFFGLILLYTLIFERKNLFYYKLLALMLLAMINIDSTIRLIGVGILYYIFTQKRFDKYVFYIFGATLGLFFLTGGIEPIWLKLKGYVVRESVEKGADNLHFFSVAQTIREAGKIPFETFANRISGSIAVFLLSLGGYGYLLYRHRIMLLSLPLVGLGFLAYFGGLRFTIYAVPVLAFGIAFIITEIANKMPTRKLYYLSLTAFTLMILFPNYKHIQSYKVPTVFNADEVAQLALLKTKAQREDYTIGWWDYGYPIRYYADTKTLADGGLHNGAINFPVSYILTHPQEQAAKMARLDVVYTEKKANDKNLSASTIALMSKAYGYDDVNDFLVSLETDIALPAKKRDIYLYLPYRMLNIYSTVALFSNLDLITGNKFKQPVFIISRNFKDLGRTIRLAPNIALDKRTGTLQLGNKKMPLRRFVTTMYDKEHKLHVKSQFINFSSNLSVIFMRDYHTFLIVDEKTYNSTYVQLFILENYDKKLYEPVSLTPRVKIYKLKI